MIRIIIAGSRSITNKRKVFDTIKHVQKFISEDIEIVSGCAQGPDTFAIEYAAIYDIPVRRFPANWKEHGKQAGILRNIEMANYADMLLAFWDDRSRGTKNMIEEMTKRNKNIILCKFKTLDNVSEVTFITFNNKLIGQTL